MSGIRFDKQKLKTVIPRARLAKGWNQTKLGYLCGVSESLICKVESGERRGPQTIVRICRKLGLDPMDLLEDEVA